MKYIFVCREHEDFGCNGWALKSQPGFDPLQGMAVAHDVLEHFPGGDDSPAHEFMALGASMWVREDYYSHIGKHHTDAGVHIAADMPEIFRHVVYEKMYITTPPRTTKCAAEEQIDIAFRESAKNIMEDGNPEWQELLDAFSPRKDDIRGWMRIGYRKVQRRFHGVNQWNVTRLFMDIEKRADELLKHAELGDELVVSLLAKQATAELHLRPAYEEY
jgi:hypothetical protein